VASFGAPRGKRLGDAAKAMPFHRLAAATPPIALRRPNPKGIFQIANFLSRRGPDATGICSRDALEARTGSPGGCVLSAAGSAARRRDAGDPLRSFSRSNAADDPRAARTLRARGHCGRIRRLKPRPMHNGIESRLATGLRPQAPHEQPPGFPVRASNLVRKPQARRCSYFRCGTLGHTRHRGKKNGGGPRRPPPRTCPGPSRGPAARQLRTMITTRRFLARPSRVLLLSTGCVSP
jgi:hypothetical protein